MEYPKINSLWKRYGANLGINDRQKIIEQYGNLPLVPGLYSEKEFPLVEAWDVEEKIDGTSIRITLKEINKRYFVSFEGRSKDSILPSHVHDYLTELFTPERLLKGLKNTKIQVRGGRVKQVRIIFYGELFGYKIQGDYYDIKETSFILFDVYAYTLFSSREEVRSIARAMGIKSAPSLGMMTEHQIINYVKSNPQSEINPEKIMEGVVCRGEAWETQEDGMRLFRGIKKFKLRCEDMKRIAF